MLPDEREELDGFETCLALNATHRHAYGRIHSELVATFEGADGTLLGGANFLATAIDRGAPLPSAAIALNYVYVEEAARGRGLLRITAEGERTPLSHAARYLDIHERLSGDDDYDRAEMAINQAKLAEYRDYERFRYVNPFRYDTERDVFSKLEELRGITRKKEALALAIESLEDHASDLQRRHQRKIDADATRREAILASLLGATGIFGAGQMIYWIGESAAADPYGFHQRPATPIDFNLLGLFPMQLDGERIMSLTESAMLYSLIIFIPAVAWLAGSTVWGWVKNLRQRAAYKRTRDSL